MVVCAGVVSVPSSEVIAVVVHCVVVSEVVVIASVVVVSEAQKKTLNDSIRATADQLLSVEEKQGYGIPYQYEDPYEGMNESNRPYYPTIVPVGYEPGSNAKVLSNMIAMSYAYDLTAEEKYADGVLSGMNYLLGNNPVSFSYITGCGRYKALQPGT